MPLLYALAIMAVVAILSPRTFFAIMVTCAMIYILAPPRMAALHPTKRRHRMSIGLH